MGNNKVNMSVKIAGVTLKNPVITASGTCGYGREYSPYYLTSEIGAIAVKAITLSPRMGNSLPRIAETPMGILNSIGLQNPGVEYFIKNELPTLKETDTVVIANVAGSSIEDYCAAVELLDNSNIDMIELNISCPNVKQGGIAFGTRPEMAENITKEVRKYTTKPLIVKLSPNVSDITEIAKAVVSGGADALSLINTLLGMRIDIKSRKPILANITGGLSGPAIFPVAVRMVWQVRNAVSVPLIGMGGISTGDDAVEMMLAGADAIAVGTAAFSNPYALTNIRDGIEKYCSDNNISNVTELTGRVKINV